MKKNTLLFLLCLAAGTRGLGAQQSGAQDLWQMPDRIVEFGFDLEGGYASNLIKLKDVFNFQKTLLIDLSSLGPGELFMGEKAAFSTYINVNVGKNLSFGLFTGAQIDAYQSASEDFTKFLRRGNAQTRSINGGMEAGASAFIDAGVKAQARIGKLRFMVAPAAFVPLLYVPPPDVNFSLVMTPTGMSLKGTAGIDIYSAFSMEKLAGDDQAQDSSKLIPSPMPLGFDLGLEGVYTLLPSLDLGLNIAHIPLFPAELHSRMRQEVSMEGDWSNMYNSLTQGDFDIPEAETVQTFDDASFFAFRPLRIDFFADYRPMLVDMFVIRPHAGLSALTIFGYDTVCFNAGLEGRINLVNMLGFSIGTGYEEHVWKQSLGVRFNFRVIELDAKFALWGPDIISSFKAQGFGATLAVKMGF
ncbi:MAG: hypothetical protein LBQ46_13105 [Treponema sp.]|jgi:hypothetical protein|nr:hypothetical protein [Treponema sp.]